MNMPILNFGHFYSPIVDTAQLAQNPRAIWQARASIPGIDLNPSGDVEILREWFGKYLHDYQYPDIGDVN